MKPSIQFLYVFLLCCGWTSMTWSANVKVDRFGFFEASFETEARYENPYTDLHAKAELRTPKGQTRKLLLFWDGGNTWKLRISPNQTGQWRYTVRSKDPALDGKSGSFTCEPSDRRGSIQPMAGFPQHFQYQNSDGMWFLGDTAWALFTDNIDEKHNRSAAEQYLRTRATQGFNVVHSMMLSEAGWVNSGGPPFHNVQIEEVNPEYWQEVDRRVAYANSQGIVVGLALAWGDKRKQEPFAWRMFPNLEARKRYARYIAARYGAYDVYFLVSGEWHAEVRTRPSTESKMKQEFGAIGDELHAADSHQRMVGIHPMTKHGSVREFNDAAWMSFGDYQQNYRDLHARLLESRRFNKPVVNSEYGYYLRDRDGNGTPDKDNSTSLESMRHATWDLVMAGGYVVSGFGTTYFGGNRDPGPFDVATSKNDDWERQIRFVKRFFTGLDWWKLQPHDELLSCSTPRGRDARQLGRTAPPATTYWMLAAPGSDYVLYARGLTTELTLELGRNAAGPYQVRLFNPRTGSITNIENEQVVKNTVAWAPPDAKDWVLHMKRSTQ